MSALKEKTPSAWPNLWPDIYIGILWLSKWQFPGRTPTPRYISTYMYSLNKKYILNILGLGHHVKALLRWQINFVEFLLLKDQSGNKEPTIYWVGAKNVKYFEGLASKVCLFWLILYIIWIRQEIHFK